MIDFMNRIFSFPKLAFAGLTFFLIATLGFLSMGHLKKQARAITDDTLPGLSFAGAANATLAQAFNRTLMLLLSDNPQQRAQLQKEIESFSQKTTAYLEAYKQQSINSSEDREQYNELLKRRAEYFRVREKTLALATMNKRREAVALYNAELAPAYQRYKEAGDKLFAYNAQQGQDRSRSILEGCTITQIVVTAVGLLVFVIGFAFGTSRHRLHYGFGECV